MFLCSLLSISIMSCLALGHKMLAVPSHEAICMTCCLEESLAPYPAEGSREGLVGACSYGDHQLHNNSAYLL